MKSFNYLRRRLRGFYNVDIREWSNQYLGKFRRKKLKGIDFTIISNNCWGGACISQIFNWL